MTDAPTGYSGVTIAVKLSPVRVGEAQFREMRRDEADTMLRDLLKERLESKYPGATVTVDTEGDRPSAEVSGLEDSRVAQVVRYDAEKSALALKWDFSQQGLGVRK